MGRGELVAPLSTIPFWKDLTKLVRSITMFKDIVRKAFEWAKKHQITTALGVAALAGVGVFYFGSAIIVTGVVAGILLSAAFGILLWKVRSCEHPLVKRAYAAMIAHPLLSDIGFTAIAFVISPVGVTGWISASVCGLMVSMWLLLDGHLSQEPMKEIEACCQSV